MNAWTLGPGFGLDGLAGLLLACGAVTLLLTMALLAECVFERGTFLPPAPDPTTEDDSHVSDFWR